MAGLVPAIHDLPSNKEDVDARHKAGHDGGGRDAKREITKDGIFHYVYAVLHDPVYREKYALNLKREFPRIPFYDDFWRWADWGEKLMALHLGYETVEPWPLVRLDAPDERSRAAGVPPKALLRADKGNGAIRLDTLCRDGRACVAQWFRHGRDQAPHGHGSRGRTEARRRGIDIVAPPHRREWISSANRRLSNCCFFPFI
jgi:hypothetical protein